MEIRYYVNDDGHSPFRRWANRLNPPAAARVVRALGRIEEGNMSNVRGVGGGVFEYRIHFGPGYRLYFGKDGEDVIILLAGGTKKRQQADIQVAQNLWKLYKAQE